MDNTNSLIKQKNTTIRTAYKEIEKLKAELAKLRAMFAKTVEVSNGK